MDSPRLKTNVLVQILHYLLESNKDIICGFFLPGFFQLLESMKVRINTLYRCPFTSWFLVGYVIYNVDILFPLYNTNLDISIFPRYFISKNMKNVLKTVLWVLLWHYDVSTMRLYYKWDWGTNIDNTDGSYHVYFHLSITSLEYNVS